MELWLGGVCCFLCRRRFLELLQQKEGILLPRHVQTGLSSSPTGQSFGRFMDVHAATPYLRTRLFEALKKGNLQGLRAPNDPVDERELMEAVNAVSIGAKDPNSAYWADADYPIVVAALEKIWNRRLARDPDLDGAYACGFFLNYWTLCETRFPDLKPTVTRELAETGQTCIQGDSHRFLQLLLAVLEDSPENDDQVFEKKIVKSEKTDAADSNRGNHTSVVVGGHSTETTVLIRGDSGRTNETNVEESDIVMRRLKEIALGRFARPEVAGRNLVVEPSPPKSTNSSFCKTNAFAQTIVARERYLTRSHGTVSQAPNNQRTSSSNLHSTRTNRL